MPRKGWKTVTISEDAYASLEYIAKGNNRSVSKEAEVLIENATRRPY